MGLSENSVPLVPDRFIIILPTKHHNFMGFIPYFQTDPCRFSFLNSNYWIHETYMELGTFEISLGNVENQEKVKYLSLWFGVDSRK